MSDNSRNNREAVGPFWDKIGKAKERVVNKFSGVGEVGEKKGTLGASGTKAQNASEFPHGTRDPSKYGFSGTKVNDVTIYVTDTNVDSFLYEDVFPDVGVKPESFSMTATIPQGENKMFEDKAPEKVKVISGKSKTTMSAKELQDRSRNTQYVPTPVEEPPAVAEPEQIFVSVSDNHEEVPAQEPVVEVVKTVEETVVEVPTEDPAINVLVDDEESLEIIIGTPDVATADVVEAPESPVVEEVVKEVPAVAIEDVAEAPVVEETPATEIEETPVVAPVAEPEAPVVEEIPVSEAPAEAEIPEEVVKETPAVIIEETVEEVAPAEAPVVEETPAAEEIPVSEAPAEAEIPAEVVKETPAVEIEEIIEAEAPAEEVAPAEAPVVEETPAAEEISAVDAPAEIPEVIHLGPATVEVVPALPEPAPVERLAAPEPVAQIAAPKDEVQEAEIKFIDEPIIENEAQAPVEEAVVTPAMLEPINMDVPLEGDAPNNPVIAKDEAFKTEESEPVATSGAAVVHRVETGLPGFNSKKSSTRPTRNMTATAVPKESVKTSKPTMSAKALRRTSALSTKKAVEKKDVSAPSVRPNRERRAAFVEVPVQAPVVTPTLRPTVRTAPKPAVTEMDIEKAREKMSKLANPAKVRPAVKAEPRPVERLRIGGVDASHPRPSARNRIAPFPEPAPVERIAAPEPVVEETPVVDAPVEPVEVPQEPAANVTFSFGGTSSKEGSVVNFLF